MDELDRREIAYVGLFPRARCRSFHRSSHDLIHRSLCAPRMETSTARVASKRRVLLCLRWSNWLPCVPYRAWYSC